MLFCKVALIPGIYRFLLPLKLWNPLGMEMIYTVTNPKLQEYSSSVPEPNSSLDGIAPARCWASPKGLRHPGAHPVLFRVRAPQWAPRVTLMSTNCAFDLEQVSRPVRLSSWAGEDSLTPQSPGFVHVRAKPGLAVATVCLPLSVSAKPLVPLVTGIKHSAGQR